MLFTSFLSFLKVDPKMSYDGMTVAMHTRTRRIMTDWSSCALMFFVSPRHPIALLSIYPPSPLPVIDISPVLLWAHWEWRPSSSKTQDACSIDRAAEISFICTNQSTMSNYSFITSIYSFLHYTCLEHLGYRWSFRTISLRHDTQRSETLDDNNCYASKDPSLRSGIHYMLQDANTHKLHDFNVQYSDLFHANIL